MSENWFEDARFGMFIHWGLYSFARGQWKGMNVPWVAEWLMKKFSIPIIEYEQLATQFNPTGFNAEEWVLLAKQAGMKYMVITSKHHDGFAMFHSTYDRYNIVDATPFGRDPLKELAEACEKHGIRLGFYYSQDQDWHEKGASGNTWDFTPEEKTPEAFQAYLDSKVKHQLKELLTNYGKVSIIWFDTPNTITPEQSAELKDFVHQLQPECLVSGRVGNGKGDYESLGDNQAQLTFPERAAEGLGTMNESWGYKPFDTHYRSVEEILMILAHMAGHDTNYLLNVGPDDMGRFPKQAQDILRGTGSFLAKYGDALYGSRGIRRSCPYPFPWGDVTFKGDTVYVWYIRRFPGVLPFFGIQNKVIAATLDGKPVPFTETHNPQVGFHEVQLEIPETALIPAVITLKLDGELEYTPRAYEAGAF